MIMIVWGYFELFDLYDGVEVENMCELFFDELDRMCFLVDDIVFLVKINVLGFLWIVDVEFGEFIDFVLVKV